jgi:hypothetical protein
MVTSNLLTSKTRSIDITRPSLKIILAILFLAIGLFLRIWPGTEYMLYTYDQARDVLAAETILNGHLKIVGPQTDIPGLFHGPLSYYIEAIPYRLLGGLPNALYFHIFANLLTLIPLYFLAKYLFENKKAALLSCFIFLISFEQVSYARWLSHASLIIPTLTLFYLGLYMMLIGKRWGVIIAAIGAGLAVQLELLMGYVLPVGLIFLLIFHPKLNRKNIFFGILIIFLFVSSYLAAEFKFNFTGVKGFLSYIPKEPSGFNLFLKIEKYIAQLQNVAVYNLIPQSKLFSFIALVLIFLTYINIAFRKHFSKKYTFLLFLFLANLPLFFFLDFNAHFINMGTSIPFILILTVVLEHVRQKSRKIFIFLIAALAFFNVAFALEKNFEGDIIFQVYQGAIYKDSLDLVKRTYSIANGQVFSINAVTNPLFIPTKWAYVYKQYADSKHVKIPHFHGNTASVFPGVEIFPRSGEITNYEFSILEPDLPEFWAGKALNADGIRKAEVGREDFGKTILLIRH